jgi:hypothetical protein
LATWRELVKFVRRGYVVIRDEPDEIRVRIRFEDRDADVDDDVRDQMVVVTREVLDRGDEWAQIATPFARVGEVDLAAVLTEVGDTTVVGSVVVMGDYLVLRHSVPLANLDLNEFTDPMDLVADAAERLEMLFVGRDVF